LVPADVALKAAGINKERVVKPKREVLVCAAVYIYIQLVHCKKKFVLVYIILPVALKVCSERPIPPNKKQQPST
jgi:hypothetical protein